MGVKSAMRQTSFFHDVGNTRTVITATPDGPCGSINDALV